MPRVIVAINATEAMPAVLAAAAIVSAVYESDLDLIHVEPNAGNCGLIAELAGRPVRCIHGDTTETILQELAAEDVLIGVMGARERAGEGDPDDPAGHVALAVALRTDKPLVLVPPEWPAPAKERLRLLVPLDGTEEASITVAALVNRVARSDVEIVVLHVFDENSTPLFLDRPEHDLPVWGEEFLARHCDLPGSRLQWRIGATGGGIAEAADLEDVDTVVLGWHQVLAPGRAAAVRDVLARVKVPVVLVPRIAAERALAVTAAAEAAAAREPVGPG